MFISNFEKTALNKKQMAKRVSEETNMDAKSALQAMVQKKTKKKEKDD
jgi:hypothetical protein